MGFISWIQKIVSIAKNGIDVGYFISNHHSFKRKKLTHYFENYHKHVTIYNDGTGVIINEFDIIFNKNEQTYLKRGIDISDGKKDACFPSLTEMQKTDVLDRFSKYGFWVYSEDNIISSVNEKYWSDTEEGIEPEDIVLKKDNKVLRWIFNFNYSKIKPNKKYKVVYVMSIPCMYPIENGKLCIDSINDKQLLSDLGQGNSTSMKISNPIRNFRYTISFENGILLEREPECKKLVRHEGNQPHPKLSYAYNVIYKKYTCCIKKPTIGSIIKINWQFKED